jgi:hypothetical protein
MSVAAQGRGRAPIGAKRRRSSAVDIATVAEFGRCNFSLYLEGLAIDG